jgi:hypothetical protein
LRRVDHKKRAFAGGERTVDLVGEIDMAGRVDKIEHVILAVARAVIQPHRLRLDGDAALALDIHRIQHLIDHFARFERAGKLNQPVGKRRFAVVDMGDDREVADVCDGNRAHGGADNIRFRERQAPAVPKPKLNALKMPSSAAYPLPRGNDGAIRHEL